MNLKYQFYKCYYEGLDARQLLGNNEDANVNIFEDINKAIVNVQFHPGASKSTIAGYRDYVSKLAGANRLYLKTTYPGLLIGSGYTHETGTLGEFKLGFYFDHTTGLPVIPGSSVKGVLRSVFPSYRASEVQKDHPVKDSKAMYILKLLKISGDYFTSKDDEKTRKINLTGRKFIRTLECSIFGELQGEDPGTKLEGSRDVFFDAQIVQSLAKGNKILGTDFITPHGDEVWREPKPIQFLKVLPQVVWEFSFHLEKNTINNNIIKVSDKLELFKQILLDFGVGAKTRVGYGQFEEVKYKYTPTNVALEQTGNKSQSYSEGDTSSLPYVCIAEVREGKNKKTGRLGIFFPKLPNGEHPNADYTTYSLKQYQAGDRLEVEIQAWKGKTVKAFKILKKSTQ